MEDASARDALVRGDSRYDGVARALRTLEDSVDPGDAQRLLIKPNFVSVERQLAATQVDAVRAVLGFVRARYDGAVPVYDRRLRPLTVSLARTVVEADYRIAIGPPREAQAGWILETYRSNEYDKRATF